MNYKMPKIFSSRSRNDVPKSALKHAGSQMLQNRTDWQTGSLVGKSSYGHQTPRTEYYGHTPYLTRNDELRDSLNDMNVNRQIHLSYKNGSANNYISQIKDTEEYVSTLSSKPVSILNRDFPFMKQFAGQDNQYEYDYFIRQANNFDVQHKRTWNLLEKMKYKLDNSPGIRFAGLEVQDSLKGPVYLLQWEDEEMYQASK
jgi:hypothetical protein